MTIRSKEGAWRAYDATLRGYMRRGEGGGKFGFDWPTMRVLEPETYARLKELAGLSRTLPSRRRVPSASEIATTNPEN